MTTSKEIDAENIKYKVNMDFTLGVPALAIYVICKSQNIHKMLNQICLMRNA